MNSCRSRVGTLYDTIASSMEDDASDHYLSINSTSSSHY